MELTDKALRMSRVGMNHEHKHKWPVEKRIEVVTKTLALGNMRLVSELTGVSYQLIREWKQEPWWPEIVAEIRASRTSALDTKLSRLVDKSLETVADRLENGNLYLDKKGDLQRKPLTVLEANKIANDMLTQETNVQKREVALTEGMQVQSMADTIRMLAEQFAQFNTKRTINADQGTLGQNDRRAEDAVEIGYKETSTGESGILESPESEKLFEESGNSYSHKSSDEHSRETSEEGSIEEQSSEYENQTSYTIMGGQRSN